MYCAIHGYRSWKVMLASDVEDERAYGSFDTKKQAHEWIKDQLKMCSGIWTRNDEDEDEWDQD